MDEENPITNTTTVTATVIPGISKDDTGKTLYDLDDDDEAAIVIESDDMVAIDVSNDNDNDNNDHDQLPSVEEMKARSSVDPAVVAANRSRTKKRCLITLGVICFVALVLVAIIVPVKNNNNSKKSKSSSVTELSGRSADVIDFLYTEGVSPLPALEDLYSAQHRAAIFVADGDVYQAPIGSQKLVERYVLSLIYYYFDGPEWKNNFKFLSGRDHCEWFTTETRPLGTILKGVNCNDEGYVTGLDLCKYCAVVVLYWAKEILLNRSFLSYPFSPKNSVWLFSFRFVQLIVFLPTLLQPIITLWANICQKKSRR